MSSFHRTMGPAPLDSLLSLSFFSPSSTRVSTSIQLYYSLYLLLAFYQVMSPCSSHALITFIKFNKLG